jgi:arabinan endo-1,5-alpha-L-arabinosidase
MALRPIPAPSLLAMLLAGCVGPPDVVAVGSGGEASAGSSGWSLGGEGESGAGAATSGSGGAAGAVIAGSGGGAATATVEALELTGDLETHDSCVIEAGDRYHLFHTGAGIPVKTSDDLRHWEAAGQAFDENPAWIAERVPDATDLWAPDVSWFNGCYHLYYAASTFGSGRSCIGHATNDTLDSPGGWNDEGAIICSDVDGADDDWDAIDPSTLTDADETRWMVFGSFGSGIKLIRLDSDGARASDEFYSLAERPVEPYAIQAPFVMARDGYYYLFVSFDWCCRGVSSTYNIRVGRSSELAGPYVDRDGVPMLEGGGSLLLEGNERWRGVGANTILSTQGRDYNVYHAYDANAAGRSTLRISEVAWDAAGWPVSGGP